MLPRPSILYDRLLEYIQSLPVIDTHEHMAGIDYLERFHEPIAMLIAGYFADDLHSAGADQQTLALLHNQERATEEKWAIFEDLWRKTQHTAYARLTRNILKQFADTDEMSLDALLVMRGKLQERDQDTYRQLITDANIRCIITDGLGWLPGDFPAFLRGEQKFPDPWHPVVPLPFFHVMKHHQYTARDREGILRIGQWAGQGITSLDEFLSAVFEILRIAKERGAIALKDQSAYNRTLDYEIVGRGTAEAIFNQLLRDSNAVLGWSDAKPLDDYLFHQYMRFARELELPVQIHTGHMAGTYNRVDKANARHFISVLDVHRDVQFDLFHGNYPYMGDLLFIGKNYPNVAINLCWLYIIDPVYAKELLVRSTMTVPQSKIHGFGGDFVDLPEHMVAHLEIAQEVIASALAELVESHWLKEEQAIDLAADWLFHNPNRFFKLNMEA